MYLEMNVTLFSLNYIKTAIYWVKEMIRYFTMIVVTITLKLNRNQEIRNTERVKNITQIPLFKWGFLWMETVYLWLFHFWQAMQMNKPLEEKVLSEFGCQKFIYCSDAGLGCEKIRTYNHMRQRAFIVTQSIKKLNGQDKAWALDTKGFRRVSDNTSVDIKMLSPDDTGLYYKEEPYNPQIIDQRLIVTYSPKYARYQKTIRNKQLDRACKILESGSIKKERKNPNDPARFIAKTAATDTGEVAKINYYLDEEKIETESLYDGMYAVATDLLDGDVCDILKISEGRWQIEECFRIMKTDFEVRPVYLQIETIIKAHFLSCFIALTIYRYFEKLLGDKYTCESILKALKEINFADIKEQGFIPLYKRNELTDAFHRVCGFNTDDEFITKQKMKMIQKISKCR